MTNVNQSSIQPKQTPQAIFTGSAMTLLHRIIMTLGGQVQVPIEDLQGEVFWDFQIVGGVAIFSAFKDNPNKKHILQADEETMKRITGTKQ